ncbi:MAG: energy-coupling factor transporter ATPase [Ruminococcaceae bacterium]|nr:energy-coupling factor transporter ATPase [Oscillospiraceae bacterium]
MDEIIKLNNVSFDYESDDASFKVLENFNLVFERGTFNVILGHNGSGKSTLAKLLNGLIKPASGSVSVNGLLTSDEKNDFQIKKTVGIVFQNPDNQLVSSIVEEDVAFGPENLGFSPEEIRTRVDSALKAVNMYEHREHPTHKLSGGQKQRVAIAGIIAMEPECIVLDETTAMLDPIGRKEVIDTIKCLNKEKNITVILITHFMEEAEFADRVLVMSDGEITADGTPTDVFSDVEKIRAAGLDVPQTTDLLDCLKKQGYNVSSSVISSQLCVDELDKLIKSKRK